MQARYRPAGAGGRGPAVSRGQAQTKQSVAAAPRPARTACKRPQRPISRRQSAPRALRHRRERPVGRHDGEQGIGPVGQQQHGARRPAPVGGTGEGDQAEHAAERCQARLHRVAAGIAQPPLREQRAVGERKPRRLLRDDDIDRGARERRRDGQRQQAGGHAALLGDMPIGRAASLEVPAQRRERAASPRDLAGRNAACGFVGPDRLRCHHRVVELAPARGERDEPGARVLGIGRTRQHAGGEHRIDQPLHALPSQPHAARDLRRGARASGERAQHLPARARQAVRAAEAVASREQPAVELEDLQHQRGERRRHRHRHRHAIESCAASCHYDSMLSIRAARGALGSQPDPARPVYARRSPGRTKRRSPSSRKAKSSRRAGPARDAPGRARARRPASPG